MPMLRLSLPALVVASALFAVAPASAATFPDGVAAGDATSTTARVWTRTSVPGAVTLRVSARRDLRRPVAVRHVVGRAARGGAVTVAVRGLRPGRTYFFRFLRGRARSALGRFETAPPRRREARVRFAVTAAIDPAVDPNLGVLRRMSGAHNDFNVLLGGTAPTAPATTLGAKRAIYRRVLASAPVRALRAGTGLYATWGAGEFAAGFAGGGRAGRLYRAGARAFTEFTPVVSRSGTGLYRTIRWGRALEMFVLDERSFRRPEVAGSECFNPRTGTLDPAPTLPQETREAYAVFYPQLSEPVADACLRALRKTGRTMLGHAQLVAFRRAVARSSARFKVVLSEASLSQFYFAPYDRWEGYEAERQSIIDYLRNNVSDLVVLSAGGGGGVVGDVRLRTLEPPGISDGGFDDIGVGPASAPPFSTLLESSLGTGATDPVSRYFLHRAPPYGAGMRCAATNALGYAQVEVSRHHLTVTLRGQDGKPLTDVDGTPCGPFRFTADSFTHKP